HSWVAAAARIVSTAARGSRTAARRSCGWSCARGSGTCPGLHTPRCDGNREPRHHDDDGSRQRVRDAFAPAAPGAGGLAPAPRVRRLLGLVDARAGQLDARAPAQPARAGPRADAAAAYRRRTAAGAGTRGRAARGRLAAL